VPWHIFIALSIAIGLKFDAGIEPARHLLMACLRAHSEADFFTNSGAVGRTGGDAQAYIQLVNLTLLLPWAPWIPRGPRRLSFAPANPDRSYA
jgi:hypothetical protein